MSGKGGRREGWKGGAHLVNHSIRRDGLILRKRDLLIQRNSSEGLVEVVEGYVRAGSVSRLWKGEGGKRGGRTGVGKEVRVVLLRILSDDLLCEVDRWLLWNVVEVVGVLCAPIVELVANKRERRRGGRETGKGECKRRRTGRNKHRDSHVESEIALVVDEGELADVHAGGLDRDARSVELLLLYVIKTLGHQCCSPSRRSGRELRKGS